MPASLKEALFTGCREKSCCSYYTVFPTGYDVWRIATALQVPPWDFTTPTPAADAPDALALDNSEQRFRVALAKRLPPKANGPGPCVFLLRLPDGAARCSLGNLRPRPCHSFPTVMVDGFVHVRNDGGCSCRRWTLADIEIERETGLLLEEADAQETYHRVVANWNEYAKRFSPENALEYKDFCRYLLDVYMQLAQSEPQAAEA